MAVTDLTDALPWWARQGAGPTGGPAAAPSGGAGPPGAQGMGWLQYLQQMFGQGGNPADVPSPDAKPMAMMKASQNGSSWDDALSLGGSAPTGPTPPPDVRTIVNPHGDGPPPPPPPVAGPQPGPMSGPAGPVGALPHPIMAALGGAGNGPPPQSPYNPLGGGSANTGLPAGAGPPPQPAYNPLSGGSANTGLPVGAAPAPVPGPLAGGGASAAGATSNPRFIGIDRPNAPAEGGGGMARGGGPQATALNLAGLFGRGGVNPNAPAANAQAVSALRGPLSSAPWDYGPLQKGKAWPKDMGPFTPDQTAARGLKQRYG